MVQPIIPELEALNISEEEICDKSGEEIKEYVEVSLSNNNLEKCHLPGEQPNLAVKPKKQGWNQYLGMILAVLSGVFFSLVLLLAKVLEGYHPFSLSVWRQFGNVVPSIPMVLYFRYWKKEEIFNEVWPLSKGENRTNVIGLAIRGFLGASAVILRFYSLEYLTIGDSTVITYSGPIFIVVMAHFFLEEKCGVTSIAIGIWTFFGVIIICRPPFLTGGEMDTKLLIGAGIALGVVFCQSTVMVLVRKIRKIHFSVMTLSFGVFGLLQSSIVAIGAGVFSVPRGLHDITLTAALAILSFLGQISVIMALKLEQAGPVSLIRTCDVLFAFLWQIIFLHVFPDLFSILGASIVVIGVLVTAMRKWVSTLPEGDYKRKIFGFLLR